MKRSILITDDEQAIRESLSLFFTDEGFECHSARDGKEAVRNACKKLFDLVILDLNMPRGYGLEALKRIKECSPDTTVLILTSYYHVEDAAKALELGAVKLVLKPVDFEELLDVVNDILPALK